MSGVLTYSYIGSQKQNKIKTVPIDSIEAFIQFVLDNKEFIIWANLIDVVNGDVIEQYINIKNYTHNNIDNFNLSLKGADAEIYKKVYVIHKLEFEKLIKFIKSVDESYFNQLLSNKSFKMISLMKFFNTNIARQFYVFPSKNYDLIMGEFAMKLNLSDTADFQELLPIAKTIELQIETL